MAHRAGRPDAALFAFRQRAGRFDWRQISSVNVEDIIVKWKVEELQSILDHVTFSEFLPADVKTNTIDSVTKLVHIMQLIIEYLLNHQEVHLRQIQNLHKKVQHTKHQRDKLERNNITLGEEINTYQRQLHILRKSLLAAGVPMPEPKSSAKVIDPTEDSSKTTENVIYAIMQHEQSSREHLMRILDDQRQTFAKEINALVSTIRDIKSNDSSANVGQKMEIMFESLKKQLEGQCSQIINSAQPVKPPAMVAATSSSSNTMSILKDAAREAELENLMRQQSALESLERELRQRENLLANREKAFENTLVQSKTVVSAQPSPAASYSNSSKQSAVRMINSLVRYGKLSSFILRIIY